MCHDAEGGGLKVITGEKTPKSIYGMPMRWIIIVAGILAVTIAGGVVASWRRNRIRNRIRRPNYLGNLAHRSLRRHRRQLLLQSLRQSQRLLQAQRILLYLEKPVGLLKMTAGITFSWTVSLSALPWPEKGPNKRKCLVSRPWRRARQTLQSFLAATTSHTHPVGPTLQRASHYKIALAHTSSTIVLSAQNIS